MSSLTETTDCQQLTSFAQHIALQCHFNGERYCKSLLPAMGTEWIMTERYTHHALSEPCRPNMPVLTLQQLWPKLGMTHVPCITCVTVKSKIFSSGKPDVHVSVKSDTCVVFGEVKIQDLSAQYKASAAEQFTQPCNLPAGANSAAQPSFDEAEDGDDADETRHRAKGHRARDVAGQLF